MKKLLSSLVICVVSLFITLLAFELMSWYHFGDIPTKAVLFRFIFSFLMLVILLLALTVWNDQSNKKRWKIFIMIGCIPFIITLIYAFNSSINGFSGIYLCTNCYGFKAFVDSIIFIASLLFPTYIIGIVLAVISTIKYKNIIS